MNREERLARLVELVIERGSVRLEELVSDWASPGDGPP